MLHILLSTYNGERFIAEQIDSILAQTYTEWRLFIRDDGSKDGTKAILHEYAQQYPEKIFVDESEPKGLGAMRSFEYLLAQHGEAEYFAFSDQDDVWLPDKLEISMATMKQAEQTDPNQPIVVHSDLRVVDEQLNELSPSFWSYGGIHPEILDSNIHYLAICNSVTGCAMIMNRKAREVTLPFPRYVFMHDAWIGIRVLEQSGKVIPISTPTILYRQHGDNVCGAQQYRFKLTNLRQKYEWAVRSYQTGHPLVFRNVLHFLWWKTRYFFTLHTLRAS
jgi:glycosyltransferase involved in cell wall biosynthesis